MHRRVLKLLSELLRYPDEEFVLSLDEARAICRSFPCGESRDRCERFLEEVRGRPLMDLQEDYTRTFDMDPSISLNLTHGEWGDARERGAALCDWIDVYRAEGYEAKVSELPDYLPMVLELLSAGSLAAIGWTRDRYGEPLGRLALALEKAGSPHAHLVHAAAVALGEGAPEGKEGGG